MAKIRVLVINPYGDTKTTVEVPDDVPIRRLIRPLVQALDLPLTDSIGYPLDYRLSRNKDNKLLVQESTLAEQEVANDDVLRLYVDMQAGCFLAGTSITLPDGTTKNIEDINYTDSVLSFDTELGQICVGRVTEIIKHTVSEYLTINNFLRVTPSHIVYSNGQWVKAGELIEGDELYSVEGEARKITSIKITHEKCTVYNLHLSNIAHTFFADRILVHNFNLKDLYNKINDPATTITGDQPPNVPPGQLSVSPQFHNIPEVNLTQMERQRLVSLIASEVQMRLDEVTSDIQKEIKVLGEQQTTEQERKSADNAIIVEPIFGKPLVTPQFLCDVFMIMPFRDEFDKLYSRKIEPLMADLGLTVKRGDAFSSHRGVIMDEIWSAIYASRFVIADCTEVNANVYYELGIAHTAGRPAIIITQDPSTLPFDLRHRRYISYQNSITGGDDLINKLRDYILSMLK